MAKEDYEFLGSLENTGSSTLVSGSAATVQHVITFAKPQTVKLDDNDVVEVELESVTLLMSVAELNEFAVQEHSRGGGQGVRSLPTAISGSSVNQGESTRGIVTFAIRVLRVLGIDVVGGLIDVAAGKVEEWLDDEGPGLYKIAADGSLCAITLG